MHRHIFLVMPIVGAMTAQSLGSAGAQSLVTLYTFTGGTDGSNPLSGLLAGPDGSFYGTTSGGNGTIFQLSPPAHGQTAWRFTTLYRFTDGADGAYPEHLVADPAGALYGMTNSGGVFNGNCVSGGVDYGCGTVFKLAPPASGQASWALASLYSFTGGADSGGPTGGVVFNERGHLFGFTAGIYRCGAGQCGSAYELTPPASGQTDWSLTTLHRFSGGRDGGYIGYFGLPVLDPSGRIFGIAATGGHLASPNCAPFGGCGLVFALTPPAVAGAVWREQALLTFTGHDGIMPTEGLAEDLAGTLYGTAIEGGLLATCPGGSAAPSGCGLVYRLSPSTDKGAAWTTTILHRFHNGADGGYPLAQPFLANCAMYVTTSGDEVTTFGSIDRLIAPDSAGSPWHIRTEFTFSNDINGANATGSLVERDNVIFGTTYGAGSGPAGNGTIYMFRP